MGGIVTLRPSRPDATDCTSRRAVFTSGSTFSTTSPLLITKTLLCSLRAAMTSWWVAFSTASHTARNWGDRITFSTWPWTKLLAALAKGAARNCCWDGRICLSSCSTSTAAKIWSVSSTLIACVTAGRSMTGPTAATKPLVLSTVWWAHTVMADRKMRTQHTPASKAVTVRRRCWLLAGEDLTAS
jgi:hypothetical protein